MDNTTLKKRLSTYKSEGGHLKNVSDELLMDILQAWEAWMGPASGDWSEPEANGKVDGQGKKA